MASQRVPAGLLIPEPLAECAAVYVDIAKVASSSIKAALASATGLVNSTGNPHDIEFLQPQVFDPTADRLYPGHYSFAFVRNPWDRLVSCYRDKIAGEVGDFTEFAASGVAHCLARFDVFKPNMSFGEFVRAVAAIPDEVADEHFRSQADYVTNSTGRVAIDFVGRFENLAEDFDQVAQRIGLPPTTSLPRLQAAPKRDFTIYYTHELQSLTGDRYARDIDLFGYRFSD